MARIRTLKPSFWTDERVIGLSRDARLLCIGMISHADDEGRLLATPVKLSGDIFPADDLKPRQVSKWRDELERSGLIRIYQVSGIEYAIFPRWKKHQRISKPQPSTLPSEERADTQPRNDSAPERGTDPHPTPPPEPEPLHTQPHPSRADPPTSRRQETGRERGSPPPPQPPPRAQPPPQPKPGDEQRSGEDPPSDDPALLAVVDEVRELRPEWSAGGIRRALAHPDAQERPWPLRAAALLAVARDPASQSPGRLAHDGPWWARAAAQAKPAKPAPEAVTVAEARRAATPDATGPPVDPTPEFLAAKARLAAAREAPDGP